MEVEKSVKPAACSKVAAVEEICPWTMLSHHEFVPLRVGEGLKCGDGEEVFFLVKEEKVECVLTKKEGKRHKRLNKGQKRYLNFQDMFNKNNLISTFFKQ